VRVEQARPLSQLQWELLRTALDNLSTIIQGKNWTTKSLSTSNTTTLSQAGGNMDIHEDIAKEIDKLLGAGGANFQTTSPRRGVGRSRVIVDEDFKPIETMDLTDLGAMLKREDVQMSKDTREWLPEDYPFPGQRVILNPEGEGYSRHSGYVGNNAGYVISIGGTASDIPVVLSNGKRHMPTWSVRVRFDNQYTRVVKVRDLLLIDEPLKEVTEVELRNGDIFYDVEGVMDNSKNIIRTGSRVLRTKVYDKKFKDDMIVKAYGRMNATKDDLSF
jgi:hypothetical protein